MIYGMYTILKVIIIVLEKMQKEQESEPTT